MVGLDFSAAFDRVNHNALIYKLKTVEYWWPISQYTDGFLD